MSAVTPLSRLCVSGVPAIATHHMRRVPVAAAGAMRRPIRVTGRPLSDALPDQPQPVVLPQLEHV
jgi:hypothetical protein